jgi:hypothetical protein
MKTVTINILPDTMEVTDYNAATKSFFCKEIPGYRWEIRYTLGTRPVVCNRGVVRKSETEALKSAAGFILRDDSTDWWFDDA